MTDAEKASIAAAKALLPEGYVIVPTEINWDMANAIVPAGITELILGGQFLTVGLIWKTLISAGKQ